MRLNLHVEPLAATAPRRSIIIRQFPANVLLEILHPER